MYSVNYADMVNPNHYIVVAGVVFIYDKDKDEFREFQSIVEKIRFIFSKHPVKTVEAGMWIVPEGSKNVFIATAEGISILQPHIEDLDHELPTN